MAGGSAVTDVLPVVERKHSLAMCEVCPLYKQPLAVSTGPSGAKIAVVSRSPGYHEAQAGKSFSGPAGKILNHLLKMYGVERKDVLTTNVVLCYTDKPNKEAIAACKPRLDDEIKEADTLLLCGAEASKAYVGKSVREGRGNIHHVTVAGRESPAKAVVTFNPAAAIRDDGVFPDLVRDFRRAIRPVPPKPLPTVRWTDDPREAIEWISRISVTTVFAADIESTGLEHDSQLVSIGIGTAARSVVLGRNAVSNSDVRARISKLLSDPSRTVIWHNGKFDVKLLRYHGIDARVDEDTLLLSYVLDERPGSHDLDFLSGDRLGWPDYTPAVVREGKKKGHWIGREDELAEKYKMTWDEYAPLLYQYNGYDTSATFLLHEILHPEAHEDDVLDPYYTFLIPASNAFADIELRGIAFDAELAQKILTEEVLPELEQLEKDAQEISGHATMNLNSPKQVAEYMYDELGLKHYLNRRGKERSTDAAIRKEILEGRAAFETDERDTGSSFIQTYDRFKKLDKVRSTYIEALLEQQASDGRIHCNFKLHGTETGRLSSDHPNLQNQPRPSSGERLPNVRALFKASEGYTLLSVDYSQAELRVVAVLSDDESLQHIYNEGLDLHTEVANEFYGKDFTKEQRVRAKAVNFGIVYGQESYSFAQQHQISISEADRIIATWWKRFPQVRRWVKENHRKILQEGCLISATKRKRRFYLITEENKHHMLKEGVNFLVQNPASDLTLWSLLQLHTHLNPAIANILVTVHDSILLEVLDGHMDEVKQEVQSWMTAAADILLGWQLPFEIDMATGSNWGELG